MTYTQFISTMNHMYNNYGAEYVVSKVEDWWSDNYKGYSIGILEYCCCECKSEIPTAYSQYLEYKEPERVFTESMNVMVDVLGADVLENYWDKAIPVFKKHNVCITEVGNAI